MREAIEITDRLGDALAEVHAIGIVHRDLKPSNVILTPRGPKVLDFGLASVRGAVHLTSSHSVMGSPIAMSPEQIRGESADNRSDLWALGVMLHWMLTGRPPFQGDTFEAVAHAVLNQPVPPPSTSRAGIGGDLDYITLKLLRKDVAHRYSRAEDLLADLRNCEACLTTATAPVATAPRTPRLAVMYFEVMSAEPDDAFLAAGLTEDLIVDLTRVESVRVATRAEVVEFRDRNVPPRTLGRELEADYVLLGSVRRAGQRARISAQLVRATDGHTLWADRFDRTLEDLFDVQAEVSRRIVEALQLKLAPAEREQIDRAPTTSPEAYRDYLRAIELMDHNRADNLQAEVLLRHAIGLDPRFALAHASLGLCLATRASRWWSRQDVSAEALESAERAMELDPGRIVAEVVDAMVHRLRGDTARLVPDLERLRAKNPDDPLTLEWMGWSYMTLDRPADAIPLFERLVKEGRANFVAASHLATCYGMVGRTDEEARQHRAGTEMVVEWLRRHPEDALARVYLGLYLVMEGRTDEGLRHVVSGVAFDPESGRVRYNAACAYARAGLADRAMAELKEGVSRAPEYIRDWPYHDPDLDSLHGDPEFERMFGPARPRA